MTTPRAIVTGPDPEGIGDGLASGGAAVARIDGPVTLSRLEEANIGEAHLLLITDSSEATAIPLARELHPQLSIVVYTATGVPEFASHQVDLVIDPEAMQQEIVVEELLDPHR